MSTAGLVIDCTVEGLLHAPELGAILAGGGARVLMISNEHPDIFERLGWDPDLPRRVELAHEWLRSAAQMRVTSDAGHRSHGGSGRRVHRRIDRCHCGPGSIAHWPGGLVIAFPAANTVNGRLVMAAGDLNLTFNRIVESPIELTIVDDHITEVGGSGVDAQLFRSYLASFGDRASYATSHVGWGMNEAARWETVELYDRRETWGTEARAIAGNFLYSTGANEVAGRFTAGHFDLPMRHCTVALDGTPVVVRGELVRRVAQRPGGRAVGHDGAVRVAYTLEQCWHRVPGGTGVAAMRIAEAMAAQHDVTLLGVAGRHAHVPSDPWSPSIPIGHLPVGGPLLYDLWLRRNWPKVERATGPIDVAHATTVIPCATDAPLVVTVHDLAFLHDPSQFTDAATRSSGAASIASVSVPTSCCAAVRQRWTTASPPASPPTGCDSCRWASSRREPMRPRRRACAPCTGCPSATCCSSAPSSRARTCVDWSRPSVGSMIRCRW